MSLPKSWNEVTIKQFQELYFLLGKKPTIDTWILVLSSLTKKHQSYYYSLPIKELTKQINSLRYLTNPEVNTKINKYLTNKGKVYKAVLFASDMKMNQVADLKGLMHKEGQTVNDTIVENLHKLLACIYVPLTWKGFTYTPSKHKEVSEQMLNLKVGDVYGAVFFYSKTYKALMKAIEDYGQENLKVITNHLKEIEESQTQTKTLHKDGVGR